MQMFKAGRHSRLDLRASLRAATTLEARYGFPTLLSAVADGNLSVIADVIETSSDCRDFLKEIENVPLIQFMPRLLEQLQEHVFALAGLERDSPEEASGERIPFAEYHARLFRLGTGWLGWSPETTWQATPKEIIHAYQGRVEMLKAIYGSKDEEKRTPTERPENAVFDRAGLAKLRHMGRVT
jgi:hypothetical protein